MLQIKDIRKQYKTGDLVQTALDGVSLNLRDNEFVSILGPSGSGKTTLLNVIGGLDRYDSGDLIINGISTKEYTDRDWDSYRNHTIGFIFQSYNLIPHQTVLSNVELALTISGISRRERRRRAKAALESVGLGNQLHKKPNQMSGGQMQRVAIARALVNNPDILLADEPTGALDSDTSVQVMELLKEVSKDRLVDMVTHNPELAEEYSSRIVRLRDGMIIDDTNPYEVEVDELKEPEHRNMGRSSMSVFTSLALSFNNLWTKKARTLLTSFAGSIGIIGIALIMSLSTGFQKYIDKIQEDTLSTYPLTIQAETADMMSAMTAMGAVMEDSQDVAPETVREQQMISQMFAQIGSNDLGAFKTHLENNMDTIGDAINALKYGYSITPRIYAADTSDKVLQVNPGTLFGEMTGNAMMSAYMDTNVFQEMIGNRELLDSQYDVLRGRWPEASDELVMVLSNPSLITDYIAYTLGMRDPDELSEMVQQVMEGKEVDIAGEPMEWSYDDLLSLTFRLVIPSDLYRYNEEFSVWEDMSGDEEYMRDLIDEGTELKVVGIVCPKEGVSASALAPGLAYTSELTNHIIDEAENSSIVADQLSDSDVDVFTGKPFDAVASGSDLDFQDMISVDTDMLSSAFGINLSQDFLRNKMEEYMEKLGDSVTGNTAPAQADFIDTLRTLATGMLEEHISNNTDPSTGAAALRLTDAEIIVSSYLSGSTASSLMAELEAKYDLPEGTLAQVYRPLLLGLISNYVASVLPETELPETVLPDIELPEDELPDIELPEGELPEIEIPEIEIPEGGIPDIEMPDIELPDVELPELPDIPLVPTQSTAAAGTTAAAPTTASTASTTTAGTTVATQAAVTTQTSADTAQTDVTAAPTTAAPTTAAPTTAAPTTAAPTTAAPTTAVPTTAAPTTAAPTTAAPTTAAPTVDTEAPVAAARSFVGERTIFDLLRLVMAVSGTDAQPPADTDASVDTEAPADKDDSADTEEPMPIDPDLFAAQITMADVGPMVDAYMTNAVVNASAAAMSLTMTEAALRTDIASKMSEFSADMMMSVARSFNVDANKLTSAFNFELDEEELARLMNAFSDPNRERSADSNLHALGYADRSQPTSISVYMVDFTAKERFLAFIDGYNRDMEESGREEMVINYTDMTGVLMSSVKTIVDSVSYVLIAFVAVSLIVSSIMIGIITYISVLERTKEIGVLRAIGASKKNISQVFNAETFIIGLCSGAIGVGITLALLPPINAIIHALTEATDINAQLPVVSAVVLVVLSMLLTIIGGLIPSRKAANRDPVIALRSE